MRSLLIVLVVLILAATTVLALGYIYLSQTSLSTTNGRTNILLLGVDDAADLSDTIMVMSIQHDNSAPEVVLTSIPRDLWVEVPEFGGSKINAVHALGERNDYPGGGPALTAATLENVLGDDIHYYATLDFGGFEALVDAVGGVEIEVEQSINDQRFPERDGAGYDPFTIEPGLQEMDGEQALRYARSRQTTSDFDRAYRQQQIVVALRDEVLNDGMPDVVNAWNLLNAAEREVATDMNRADKIRLATLLRNVDTAEIPRYVIDTSNLLVSSPRDGSSLDPRAGDFSEVQSFFADIFQQTMIDEYESAF